MSLLEQQITAAVIFDSNNELLSNVSQWVDQCNSRKLVEMLGTDCAVAIGNRLLTLLKDAVSLWCRPLCSEQNRIQKQLDVLNTLGDAVGERDTSEIHLRHMQWIFFKDRVRAVVTTFESALPEQMVHEVEELAIRLSQLVQTSTELFRAASAIELLSDDDKLQSMTPEEASKLNSFTGKLELSSCKPIMQAFDAVMTESVRRGWRKTPYSFEDPSAPVLIYQQKHLLDPSTDQMCTKTFYFVPVNLVGLDNSAGNTVAVLENVLECLISSSAKPLLHAALIEQGGKDRLLADIKRAYEPYRLPDLIRNRHLFTFNDGVFATHFPLHPRPEQLLTDASCRDDPFHRDFYNGIGRPEHFCYALDPRIASGSTTVPGSEYPCSWNDRVVTDIPPQRARTMLSVQFLVNGRNFDLHEHVSLPFMRGRYSPTQLLSYVTYTLVTGLAAAMSLDVDSKSFERRYRHATQQMRQPPLQCCTARGVSTWCNNGTLMFQHGRAVQAELVPQDNLARAHKLLSEEIMPKPLNVHPVFGTDISRVCIVKSAIGDVADIDRAQERRATVCSLVRQFHLRLWKLRTGQPVPDAGPFKSMTADNVVCVDRRCFDEHSAFLKRCAAVSGDQTDAYAAVLRMVEHETLFNNRCAEALTRFLVDPNRIRPNSTGNTLPDSFIWVHRDFVQLADEIETRSAKRAKSDNTGFPVHKWLSMCNDDVLFEISPAYAAMQCRDQLKDFLHVDDLVEKCILPGAVGVCDQSQTVMVTARNGVTISCSPSSLITLPLLEQYRGDGLCPRNDTDLAWKTMVLNPKCTVAPNNIAITNGSRTLRVAFDHRLSGINADMLRYATDQEHKSFGNSRVQQRDLLLHMQRRLSRELRAFYATGDWQKIGNTKLGRVRCEMETFSTDSIVDIVDQDDNRYYVCNCRDRLDEGDWVMKDSIENLGSAWQNTSFARNLRQFDCVYDIVLQERNDDGDWCEVIAEPRLVSARVDGYHRDNHQDDQGSLLNFYLGFCPRRNVLKARDNRLCCTAAVFGSQRGVRKEGKDGFTAKNDDLNRMRKYSMFTFRECIDTAATQRFFPHNKSNNPLAADKSELDPSLCAVNFFDESFEHPKRFAPQSAVEVGTFSSMWHPKACDENGRPLYSVVGILPKWIGIVPGEGPYDIEGDPDEKFIHAEQMDRVTRVQLDSSMPEDHETAQRTTYGMLGRMMHYGGWDNMQVALLIWGKGETGKSAMVSQLRRVYPEEFIGQLTSNLEPLFGLSPLMKPVMKYMALCPELKGQGPLPPTDLLSSICCEEVSAAVKNGRPAVGRILFNCFFLGNDLPEEWVREGDRGNAMSRRFVVRLFQNQVRRIDNHLQSKAQRTMGPFIAKATRSYARMCWSLGQQGIYEGATDIRGHKQKHVLLGRHYIDGNRKFLEMCNRYMACLVCIKDEFVNPAKYFVLPTSPQKFIGLFRTSAADQFDTLVDCEPRHTMSRVLRYLCNGVLPSESSDLDGADEYLIYYRDIHKFTAPLRLLLNTSFFGTAQEHTEATHRMFREVCAARNENLKQTVTELLHGCDPVYVAACVDGDEVELNPSQCAMHSLNESCSKYLKKALNSYVWMKDLDIYSNADRENRRSAAKWDKSPDAISAIMKDAELSQFFFASKGLNPTGVLLLLRKYDNPPISDLP